MVNDVALCGACMRLGLHQNKYIRYQMSCEWKSCEGLIQQYNHAKSKYSIETLRSWAKRDTGFESFRHKSLETVANSLPKNREDQLQLMNSQGNIMDNM